MLCTKCGASFDNPNHVCPECGAAYETVPPVRAQQGPENTRFAGVQAAGEVVGRMVDAKYRRAEKKSALPNWVWGVLAAAGAFACCALLSQLFQMFGG